MNDGYLTVEEAVREIRRAMEETIAAGSFQTVGRRQPPEPPKMPNDADNQKE